MEDNVSEKGYSRPRIPKIYHKEVKKFAIEKDISLDEAYTILVKEGLNHCKSLKSG